VVDKTSLRFAPRYGGKIVCLLDYKNTSQETGVFVVYLGAPHRATPRTFTKSQMYRILEEARNMPSNPVSEEERATAKEEALRKRYKQSYEQMEKINRKRGSERRSRGSGVGS